MNSSFPNRWSFSYLKFTKYVSNIIAEPKYKYGQQEQVTVLLLFNRSLQLGQVPSQWKMANVSAIFKGKGSEQETSNYRPISITSCIGKMLEKINFEYLYNYLKKIKL